MRYRSFLYVMVPVLGIAFGFAGNSSSADDPKEAQAAVVCGFGSNDVGGEWMAFQDAYKDLNAQLLQDQVQVTAVKKTILPDATTVIPAYMKRPFKASQPVKMSFPQTGLGGNGMIVQVCVTLSKG